MNRAGVKEDIQTVWNYVEQTLAPFVNGLFESQITKQRKIENAFASNPLDSFTERMKKLSEREVNTHLI